MRFFHWIFLCWWMPYCIGRILSLSEIVFVLKQKDLSLKSFNINECFLIQGESLFIANEDVKILVNWYSLNPSINVDEWAHKVMCCVNEKLFSFTYYIVIREHWYIERDEYRFFLVSMFVYEDWFFFFHVILNWKDNK